MLSHSQTEKLKANWGEKANSMACMAEVRLYDPLSLWECYIYALNPEDDDEIECIIKVGRNCRPTLEQWQLSHIQALFNAHGEGVQVDQEYRPRRAAELFKKLNEGIL